MSLRPAAPEDAPAMGAILSDWIDGTAWMPRLHTRAEDRGFAAGIVPRSVVWAKDDVQGFLTLDGPQVDCLYVAEAERGRGIGRALLDHAKSRAKRLELWTFDANEAARRFYAREGFQEVERTDGAGNAERLPDVRLVWTRGETE